MTLARREGREACPLKSVIMCFFAAAPARRRRPRRIALHIRVRPARMLRRDNGSGPLGLGRKVERDAQEIEIITLKTQVDALK